mmetsp:Transcript_5903/g.21154  ORF Transcript_5903/g.21154 Transcript_5903/m.21154 type:complete len:237 (-) Transcript_5903:305-1015(-)
MIAGSTGVAASEVGPVAPRSPGPATPVNSPSSSLASPLPLPPSPSAGSSPTSAAGLASTSSSTSAGTGWHRASPSPSPSPSPGPRALSSVWASSSKVTAASLSLADLDSSSRDAPMASWRIRFTSERAILLPPRIFSNSFKSSPAKDVPRAKAVDPYCIAICFHCLGVNADSRTSLVFSSPSVCRSSLTAQPCVRFSSVRGKRGLSGGRATSHTTSLSSTAWTPVSLQLDFWHTSL